MKRRKFVAGAAGVIGGDLMSTPSAKAQATGLTPHRSSQLFTPVSGASKPQIQDLLLWDNLIYCLYFSLADRRSGFSVTKSDGSSLWECELPAGKYLGIGLQGRNVVLTALTFQDSTGRNQANCVVRLDPTGATELVQSLGPSLNGRFAFAGDSTFVRVDNSSVDVWRLNGSAPEKHGQTDALPSQAVVPHVDLLSSGTAALTWPDGSAIAIVDLGSGGVVTHAINSPEVRAGIASYRSRMASDSAMDRTHPGVIPATGSDGAGSIYGMVLPALPTSVPIDKFDETGNGTLWKSIRISPKTPARKLLLLPGEFGVAFADGSVSWYPAA
jgi:hypothetical protein